MSLSSIPKSFSAETAAKTLNSAREFSSSPVPRMLTFSGKEPFYLLHMHGEQIDPSFELQGHSLSARVSVRNLQNMAGGIREYLQGKIDSTNFPLAVLSQILAHIYYDQYDSLCPNGHVLILALQQAGLLEPTLLAIYHLTTPGNPFTQILSENLLKIGLQILEHPHAQIDCEKGLVQDAVDHILSVSKRMRSPEMQDLVAGANDAWQARLEKTRSVQSLTEEGLQMLGRCMHDEQDKLQFQQLKKQLSEPFYEQKLFFHAMQIFFLQKRYRLRLNQLQEESLVQLGFNLLLSPECAPLLKDLKIREIGQQILTMSPIKLYSPRTQRSTELTAEMLRVPFISLKELQFLLLWTQKTFPELKAALNILAGVREWDPHGKLYQFAMARFLDLNKSRHKNQSTLYQLLRFLYYWRMAPANQELLSLPPFNTLWIQCLAVNALEEYFQLKIHKEFSEKISPESLYIKPHTLGQPNPVFSADPDLKAAIPHEPYSVWKKETAVKDIRDSVLVYLLTAREAVTIADLVLFPRKKTAAITTQARRFNQVTQFFTKQLLAASQTADTLQSMVKILCLVQEDLLKHAAFEAAWAIYLIFQQASISRFHLFKDDQEWCNPLNNFQGLRVLQEENSNAFEVSPLIFKDLTSLRENPHEFTEEGEINLDRLQHFGKAFNYFASQKRRALVFWTSQNALKPDLFLIKAFDAQSDQIGDETLQQKWWDRSQEIYH